MRSLLQQPDGKFIPVTAITATNIVQFLKTIMKPTAIYIFARWQVKEGQLPVVLSLLPDLVRGSRAEEGNISYKIYQSRTDANLLLLSEAYVNEAAFETHRGSTHFQDIVVKQIAPLLEKREVELTDELT